jgi:3-oxoacyl-[acyl-carrier protein] reductase
MALKKQYLFLKIQSERAFRVKSVLIIGASSSIGKELIDVFLKNQYTVMGTYNNSKLQEQKNLSSIKLDLDCNKSIDEFNDYIDLSKLNFDVCIFMSGILPGKNLDEYSKKEIDNVMSTNFSGFAKLYKKLKNNLVDKSHLIIVSSISGQRGSYDPIYAGSKGALISFVKSLSQIEPLRTRANVVAPALIQDSKMFQDMNPSRQKFHIESTPTKKLTKKEDIANIIFDMTKEHWSNVNGEVIKINGGTYV